MVCMGSLIAASKNLYEVAENNDHWSKYSVRFNTKEVNFFEREFLNIPERFHKSTSKSFPPPALQYRMSYSEDIKS